VEKTRSTQKKNTDLSQFTDKLYLPKSLDIKTDLSIYFTGFMIGWSKINERSHDMTLNRMLLDVSVSPKKKTYNKCLISIRYDVPN
jgi:hypothetical protein